MRALRALLGGLIWLGVVLMLGGAALFVYVIFVRAPDIEEGGIEIASVAFDEDQRVAVLETPPLAEATLIQPRLDFIVHTDWVVETRQTMSYGQVVGTAPAFRQWTRMSFDDDRDDPPVERTVDVSWETAERAEVPEEAPEPAESEESITSTTYHYRMRPPVPAPAGGRVTVRVELLALPEGDLDRPMHDTLSNLGRLGDVRVALYGDVADVLAHDEFNAEAPAWGIYAGLAGLALIILAGFTLGKLPAAPKPSGS
jgi:hypothetical protein